jgi:hypothetical protein
MERLEPARQAATTRRKQVSFTELKIDQRSIESKEDETDHAGKRG